MRTIHYFMISMLVMCCLEWSFAGVAAEYDPDVYEAQKRLDDLGYDPGPIDGLMGNKTKTAIKQFQKDQGLSVTGKLDGETQEKLGLHTTEPNIRCAFAGTGATLSFGDKRLNFTCPTKGGNDVGLLGNIIPTDKGWEIERVVIGHTDKYLPFNHHTIPPIALRTCLFALYFFLLDIFLSWCSTSLV